VYVNPDSIRTAYPSAWPQYPFNEPPDTPEQSLPRYAIYEEEGIRIPMRDGITLAADLFRPYAPGEKFPALVAWSPYSRQLQHTPVPLGQNEAGITQFWVPRGYVHIVVDARGSNDSGRDHRVGGCPTLVQRECRDGGMLLLRQKPDHGGREPSAAQPQGHLPL
jgi:predicted acyl esterase